MPRQTNETMQQYRGRCKRELNAANDALRLQPGEPVRWGSKHVRFSYRMIDRRCPSRFERLTGKDLAEFLAREKDGQEQIVKEEARREEREIFDARPEVQAAETIRYLIENDIRAIVGKLTSEEWLEFLRRLKS